MKDDGLKKITDFLVGLISALRVTDLGLEIIRFLQDEVLCEITSA